MQNQDRENLGEEMNLESVEGAQSIEMESNLAEEGGGGSDFNSDPPIIVQGGGQE